MQRENKRTAKGARSRRGKEKTNEEGRTDEKTEIKDPPPFGAREEPQKTPKEQFLFLLEFYIHHITGERLAKLNQMFVVPTSVRFQFLHFTEDDDIEVTPVDPFFEPQVGIADDVEDFYSGRSVMFATDEDTVTNKILEFIITMSVRKKMPERIKPDVLVGLGELDLSTQFAILRKEMLQCWYEDVPPSQTFTGHVPLIHNQREVGFVGIFVRMSAFGQTIITEFEAPPQKTVSSYVFKGDEVNEKALTYKCRVIDPETGDIYKDSKEDVFPGRVCMPQGFPYAPCRALTGAVLTSVEEQEKVSPRCQSDSYQSSKLKESEKADPRDGIKTGGIIQSSRGSQQPCGKAVVLKVSGLLDAEGKDKKPTVTVASESEAIGPDCPPDPEHDVFILRIGKKGLVGAGEKSDLQLEMKTPKGSERRPPIRYETREMQTEEEVKAREKKGKKKK